MANPGINLTAAARLQVIPKTLDRGPRVADEGKIAEWRAKLGIVRDDLQQLAHIDDVFWQLQAVFGANPDIPERAVTLNWTRRAYANTLAAGLRRVVDKRKGTVSLARLLGDMAANCTLLTRQRYVDLHEDKYLKERAHAGFANLAGDDLDHIPRRRILGLEKRLDSAFEKVEQFANEQVAHRAAKSSVSLTYDDARSALVAAFLVFDWCSLVLDAAVWMSPVPAIQSDWLAAFTVPWIRPGEGSLDYVHLDNLVEQARAEAPV